MRKWYMICRYTGYISGLAGLLIVLTAPQTGDKLSGVRVFGLLLLLLMFCGFLVSYILYIVVKYRKRVVSTAAAEAGDGKNTDNSQKGD